MTTKQDLIESKRNEFQRAAREGKGRLLDLLEELTGLHRKAIIRRLGKPTHCPGERGGAKRGPKELFGPAVTAALREVWELADGICAERLHPIISEYVAVLSRDRMWMHTGQTTALLLQMRLGTVKARLRRFPKLRRGPGLGATRPSGLKELVPIRTAPWNNPAPGYGEVDTVAHCGETLQGDYAYSVQYTDVAVIWTLLQAQWNKGMVATRESLKAMRDRCPFLFRGLDFDSGSEFINSAVVPWCRSQEPPILVTRTRPYKKNDHGRIEQKNYVNVRKVVGYSRFDHPGQVAALNNLYRVLEDYLNFFLPSRKCTVKERVGSRIIRRYDQAQTAYARVLAHPEMPEETKQALREKYATLNPRTLKSACNRYVRKLFAIRPTHYHELR